MDTSTQRDKGQWNCGCISKTGSDIALSKMEAKGIIKSYLIVRAGFNIKYNIRTCYLWNRRSSVEFLFTPGPAMFQASKY